MNDKLKQRLKKEHYQLVSIDLFSGPGGICTGFKWAGILPLIAVEWVDSTVQTYSITHNTDILELASYQTADGVDAKYLESFLISTDRSILIHGDINLVTNDLILLLLEKRYGIDSTTETIDVVSGGAPCESFSLAGKRAEGDARDDLFSNILRIAKCTKTKMIMFENVKGLLSKKRNGVKGAIFSDICDAFELKDAAPTYHLVSRNKETILLRACDYGVPQSRERIILIAVRSDLEDVTFTYPEKSHGEGCRYPYVTVSDAISDLPHVETREEATHYTPLTKFTSETHKHYIDIMRGQFVSEDMHAVTPEHLIRTGLYSTNSISSHVGPGHIKRKLIMLSLIPPRSSMKEAYNHLVETGEIEKYKDIFPKSIYGSHNRRLLNDGLSPTITSHCLDEILHPTANRAITVREAARLQSFPDWYQFAGPFVTFHSAKQQDRYEQVGDAVPPLLAYAIAKQIIISFKAKE